MYLCTIINGLRTQCSESENITQVSEDTGTFRRTSPGEKKIVLKSKNISNFWTKVYGPA